MLPMLIALLVAFLDWSPAQRQPRIRPPAPAVTFNVQADSYPPARVAGVVMPAAGRAKGTVFLCHGFGRSKEDLFGWNWLRRDLGWNLVAFDFRQHGQSSRTVYGPSLGYHEIWDLKAVIDDAERRGLAKPYVIYGSSMGGSVGLRWAQQDPRISGVIAVSPYRNALWAAQSFLSRRLRIENSPLSWRNGFTRMLDQVDLPTAVKQRSDLRIWILCGEFDDFREADQRAILSASASPPSHKKLFVIPRGTHSNLWRWKGDARVPSHDQIVRDFLKACE